MTVAELIEALKRVPESSRVVSLERHDEPEYEWMDGEGSGGTMKSKTVIVISHADKPFEIRNGEIRV